MRMRRNTWIVGLGAFACAALAAGSVLAGPPDTVFLVGGGRLRGAVMVDDGSGVTIQLVDGTTRTVTRAEVMRVQYADAATSAAPASASAPPRSTNGPTWEEPQAADDSSGEEDRDFPAQGRSQSAGKAIWITGLATFSVAYVATVAITGGIVASESGDGKYVGVSAIPLAGPFAAGGMLGADDALDGGRAAGLITGGTLQLVGFSFFVVGAVMDSNDDDGPASRFGDVQIVPLVSAAANGAAAVGTF